MTVPPCSRSCPTESGIPDHSPGRKLTQITQSARWPYTRLASAGRTRLASAARTRLASAGRTRLASAARTRLASAARTRLAIATDLAHVGVVVVGANVVGVADGADKAARGVGDVALNGLHDIFVAAIAVVEVVGLADDAGVTRLAAVSLQELLFFSFLVIFLVEHG